MSGTSVEPQVQSIQNLQTLDPFADDGDELGASNKNSNYVHIRIQQRNGRKTLTTVQGLPSELDFQKILKAFKKVSGLFSDFSCLVIINPISLNSFVKLSYCAPILIYMLIFYLFIGVLLQRNYR